MTGQTRGQGQGSGQAKEPGDEPVGRPVDRTEEEALEKNSEKSARKNRKKHPEKGDRGYYAYEKKKRLGVVILLYGICLLVYFTGLIRTGTNRNILTLAAILGVLPSAKWTVSLIMVLLQKGVSQEVYELTERIAGSLVHGYELCITAEEGRLPLDAVVVCGNITAVYVSASEGQFAFMEKHLRKILLGNGFGGMTVKFFLNLKQYEERISELSLCPEKYRKGLAYRPDEAHAGETRDEAVLRIIKAVSI
jgi:hypothetical protein